MYISFAIQLLAYGAFNKGYSKDYAIGVLVVAYIYAFILSQTGETSSISEFFGFIIFTLIPAHFSLLWMWIIVKSIDSTLEDDK